MSWRIVRMTLGTTSEIVKTSTVGSGVEAVTFRGATNVGRGMYLAQIIKSTGFEAPSFDIQGGGRYSGGSIFVGSRASDRELSVTLLAHGAYSPSDVKNRIHKLMSVSTIDPLHLDIFLEDGLSGKMTFTTPVYISQMTSPIFDSSSEVQIVMKMGSPAFRGEEVVSNTRVQEIADPEQDIYSMRRQAPNINFHIQRVDFAPKSTGSDLDVTERFNAPFHYDVETDVAIDVQNFDRWLGIQFVNTRGEALRLNPRKDTLSVLQQLTGASGDKVSFGVGLNSKTRRPRLITRNNEVELSQDRNLPFNITTHGGFPMGIPGVRPLSVDSLYNRLVSNNDFLDTQQRARFESARYGF